MKKEVAERIKRGPEGVRIEAPRGRGIWQGVSPPQPTRGLGERREPKTNLVHFVADRRTLVAIRFSVSAVMDQWSFRKTGTMGTLSSLPSLPSHLHPPSFSLEVGPQIQLAGLGAL